MKKYLLTKFFEEDDQVSFFPIYLIDLSVVSSVKKIIGVACNIIVTFYKKNGIVEYTDMGSYSRLGDVSQKKLLKEKNFCLKVESGIFRECKELEKFSHKLLKIEPKKLDYSSLIKLYREFEVQTLNLRAYAIIPNLLEVGKESIFSIAEKVLIKQIGSAEHAKEYLGKLTTPTKLTTQRQHELNLYRIQNHIIKNKVKKWKNDNAVINLIDKHVKKFGWIAYYYIGPAWNRNDIIKIIENNIKIIKNTKEKIKEILEYRKVTENEKRKLQKKLKLDVDSKALFDKICTMIFLKAYRKEYLIYSNFCFDPILREIGKRLELELKYVRYLTISEIEKYLSNKKLWTSAVKKIIKNRYNKGCISVAEKGKIKLLSLTAGKKYNKYIKKEKVQNESEIKELTGSCAFSGIVVGKARIINLKEEVNKIKKGEILVSRSTNPDLIIAMQKASAFVTNEGGITCHAAIVAREMKKPCVIGTKIATKVIKDGDYIEVDAGKGIVKILNR